MMFRIFCCFALLTVGAQAQSPQQGLMGRQQATHYIYAPIIGQSNASQMYLIQGNFRQSALMAFEARLSQLTGKTVVSTLDRYVRMVPTVDGSTVDGDHTSAPDSRIWWYPSSHKPGGALNYALGIMQRELGHLQQSGSIDKIAIIWFQGENGAWTIGGAGAKKAERAQRYKQATLEIFNYLRQQLGTNAEFYMVQTPNMQPDAARNSGISDAEITEISAGARMIQQLQVELAQQYPYIHLAAQSAHLPSAFSTGDPLLQEDPWHLAPQSYHTIAAALADYIGAHLRGGQ